MSEILPSLVADVLRRAYGSRADVAVTKAKGSIPTPDILPAIRIRGRKVEYRDRTHNDWRGRLLVAEFGDALRPVNVDPWRFCLASGPVRDEYAPPGVRLSIKRSVAPRVHQLDNGGSLIVHHWTVVASLT